MERKPLQPLNYQLTLENADLQPFGVRSTLALAAMSCPYAHSPSCFQKGSTQMDTLLDSLHRPHAYLPTMAPRSSNMEHSTPTSTGHQKVPHQRIPGSLRRNRTLSRDLPHHPSKGCLTSCSCSTKVPHHNVAPGAREAGRMAERRNHHPC